MEKLIRDLRDAGRSLVSSKGYSAAVIMTLSACIAVNVAIFAIVNSVLLRPLPVPKAQEIVLMANRYPKAGVGELNESSSGDYYDRVENVPALPEQAEFLFVNKTIDINGAADAKKLPSRGFTCKRLKSDGVAVIPVTRSAPPLLSIVSF